MKYPVAERFVAPQGEGLFSGVTMAFIRLVGCSVGQKTCTACDTDFDRMRPDLGGGIYSVEELVQWAKETRVSHVCLTGGEPLDRDIRPLIHAMADRVGWVHVETSGTVMPSWLSRSEDPDETYPLSILTDVDGQDEPWPTSLWLTVSPKPGYREEVIALADEVKVIAGGLGDGPGWPDVADALRWVEAGRLVYWQPRNDRLDINGANMAAAVAVVTTNPGLRLSCQLHKWLRTR